MVDPSPATLDAWLASVDLGTGYVDAEIARDALRRRGQFNLIDFATGWKVDLIVRKDRPFSRSEFDRRVAATIAAVAVYVVSAEDTILSKLEWARQGGSERQIGSLYCLGFAIEWRLLDAPGARFVRLGTYPWQREACVAPAPLAPPAVVASAMPPVSRADEVLVASWEPAGVAPRQRVLGDRAGHGALARQRRRPGHPRRRVGGEGEPHRRMPGSVAAL